MSVFVLVPGMWNGAWAWRAVTAELRAAGHEVHPLTPTGLAERSHLTDAARGRIGLDTHVDDVVRLVEAEDLHDVVLVGHSYAGIVVGCVADRVPHRLARTVYVDSGPFPGGMAHLDFYPPEEQERIRQSVVDGLVPPRDWDPAADPVLLAGLDEASLALLRSRSTPHPFDSIVQPAERIAGAAAVPATAIACTFPVEQLRQLIDSGNPIFGGLAGADLVGLPTGHWPMFSEPKQLAEILSAAAG
jgi:pimeloyl-ACP methyl ester carboxylesterase